ncbi:NAD(+) diphosphatase [Pacificibacter marinus]|uniref:NAD(+) diphosphatase n=1 Tax=Pacificibacter marinus TaxID=658057 RepID=A0A1Y5S846_9RHOB|nr:NAD(+) diphosphatase [Pacificibacter marinus]SEK77748.1 NAD+ diphosphatase [Pacificibacter marinus]SLN34003.1 NADH pyrophosphatase [Pacificibacter marinus]
MKLESMAFAAGTLSRREDLRKNSESLQSTKAARFIPFWSLKPLIDDDGGLALLQRNHPLLAQMDTVIFLGLDDAGVPLFAADVSSASISDEFPASGDLFDVTVQRHVSTPSMAFCDLKVVMTKLSPLEAEMAATGRAILGWHKTHKFCSACGVQSEAAAGGWQRDCPTCATPHYPRTDPVVIMLITHGNSVLLGRSPHFPEGMYSLLAGFVEPGEPIEAAVRREVLEEANIRVGAVSYMASQPWPFPSSLMIGCRGEALSHDITIDKTELADALWLTKEGCAQIMAGTHPTILPARDGTIAHFLLALWLADKSVCADNI